LLLLPVAACVALGLRSYLEHKEAWGRPAAVALLSLVLVLLPYSIRNEIAFGSFKPVPPAGGLGVSLWTATWQPLLPLSELQQTFHGRVTPLLESSGFAKELHDINNSVGAPENTAPFNVERYPPAARAAVDRAMLAVAVRRISAAPGTYAWHVLGNWWWLWNTQEYPASLPGIVRFALAAFAGLVTLFGYGGAGLSILRREGSGAVPLLLYFPSIHCWLHTEARYTAGARAIFLFYAATFFLWGLERLRTRWVQSASSA
jgi:hypothetical protein